MVHPEDTSPAPISLQSVEKQMEAIKVMLGSVQEAVEESPSTSFSIDEMLRTLLNHGITRHEIAFLISESIPRQIEGS